MRRRPTDDERARIEAVFDDALDVDPGARAAWLDVRCADDVVLRREVELLLAAHEREGSVLDAPPAGHISDVLDDATRDRRIGPYRVLRELGRGGMGVVYLAERSDGQFRRRVAVKVLRASPDAEELHRRFLAERQILASLSHPNIAQLLDGGVSEGELPYLVMEHIDGVPITDYCDRHRLDIDARLQLFREVCAAVHHAHQNLVLHRDLKPGNVLVTGAGRAKLLDFGIAKLLNPTLTGVEAPVTRTAFRLMTPAYASPEQVRGDSLTTTSDVYALGLLLYELLAGRPAQRIDTDSPRAVYTAVCDREPAHPSACVANDEAVAAARCTTAERLVRRLRGDLDAIVAMALRKEPGRRYGSAELLAEDVARHLEGRTVLALRGNRWYRAEKFLRRHRAVVGFASASALLLAVGAGVAFRLASVASRERDRASEALGQTQRALGESEAVTTFLVGLFEASDASQGRTDSLTAADLLRRGVARAEGLSAHPEAQARMLEALGRVYESQDNLPLATQLLRRALALRRARLGADHVQTAALEARLSNVLLRTGEHRSADSLARHALRVRRVALGDAHRDVAASLRQVGRLALFFNDVPAAEVYQRQAIAVDRRRRGQDADSALARDYLSLSTTLLRRGDYDGAVLARREAYAAARRAFPEPHAERVLTTDWLASLLEERTATVAETESLYREALDEARAAFGEEHARTSEMMFSLGVVLARNGRRDEGERLVREAYAIDRRAVGLTSLGVAGDMLTLAGMLTRDGYSAEAERLARGALAIYAKTYGTRHAAYGAVLGYVASVIATRGALDSAETMYREAITIRATMGGDPQGLVALTSVGLATVLTRRGKFAQADSVMRAALAVMRARGIETNIEVRHAYAQMAALYDAWGKRDSAALFRRRAQPPGFTAPWQR